MDKPFMCKKVNLIFFDPDESGDLGKGVFFFGLCVRHNNGAQFNAYKTGALFTGIANPETGTLDKFVALGLFQVRLNHLLYQCIE